MPAEQSRLQDHAARLEATKALVIDVDGTLKDGGMYCGHDGEALK